MRDHGDHHGPSRGGIPIAGALLLPLFLVKPGAGIEIASLLIAFRGDLGSPSGHLAESTKAGENLESQVVPLSLALISDLSRMLVYKTNPGFCPES